MSRDSKLEDQGFEKPYNSCPVTIPNDRWEYRGLINTGGYIFCRIWRHKTENKEIMYNMLDTDVVVVNAKYDGSVGQYVSDEEDGDAGAIIERQSANAELHTESDLMEVAVELMNEY